MKKIAIIFGGEGAERAVSEKSAAAIIKKSSDCAELIQVGIDRDGFWFIYSGETERIKDSSWRHDAERLTPTYPVRIHGTSGLLTDGGVIPIDLAFPILHGDMGEDGTVQGTLRTAHIPYIGSGVIPSAVSADKAFTKIIAEHLGIRTAPWFIPKGNMRAAKREAEGRLGYPMFIKPRRLGSSIGARAVKRPRDFADAYREAHTLSDGLIMIEAEISVSAELELALYDGEERFITSPGAIHSHGETYTFEKKYSSTDSPKTEISPRLDRATLREARRTARLLADYLGLGNISRIDFFLTSSGDLIFNEINSVPGMTETSLYPALVESALGPGRFPDGLYRSSTTQ